MLVTESACTPTMCGGLLFYRRLVSLSFCHVIAAQLSSRDKEYFMDKMDALVDGIKIDDIIRHVEKESQFWTTTEKREIKSKNSVKSRARALLEHVCDGKYM